MSTAIIDRLADYLELFDCSVYTDRRLMLFTEPPEGGIRRKGKHVGTVSESYADWKIESLTDDAPGYLKPLVGKSHLTANLLKNAVRAAALRNEVRKELKDLLSATPLNTRPGDSPDIGSDVLKRVVARMDALELWLKRRAEYAAYKAYMQPKDYDGVEMGPTPREAWDQAVEAARREGASYELASEIANEIAKQQER